MIDARYKRLTGPHAGQAYVVIGPNSEIEHPLRWVLHNAARVGSKAMDDQVIVSEDELHDVKRWLPLP